MTILGHYNQLREEHAASPKEAQQAQVKNTTTGIVEWYNRNGSKIMKEAKNGLKRGKPTIKHGPALERSKPIKNEKSENNSCVRSQG